ncbi:MAG: DNA-binding protein [Rhodocyclaceae bacterium]|nr:MAG: DNA-binding protein [Rhodocyclaceae bacterium]
MKPRSTRTTQEIRAEWLRKGLGQNEWARKHGFTPATVSQVLNGRNSGARGVGHKIAVMLGLKDGEIVEG